MNGALHIARVESELGVLTDSEAVEMLRAGFLSPADLCRREGTTDWRPLAELPIEVEAKPDSTFKLAQQKLAATGGAALAHAAQFTQKFKRVVARGRTQMTDSASRMLDSYTPQIQDLVANQLVRQSVTRTQAALQDDAFMRKVFGATYDCLPRPVCRFVSEEAFIQFCLERRRRLLGTVAESK
jgi:hypothetical protein